VWEVCIIWQLTVAEYGNFQWKVKSAWVAFLFYVGSNLHFPLYLPSYFYFLSLHWCGMICITWLLTWTHFALFGSSTLRCSTAAVQWGSQHSTWAETADLPVGGRFKECQCVVITIPRRGWGRWWYYFTTGKPSLYSRRWGCQLGICIYHLYTVFVGPSVHLQGMFHNYLGNWPETLYICTPRSAYITYQILVRPDSWLGHQGAKPQNTKSDIIYSFTNGWIISKFLS
jgi:hypothetical protein